MATTDWTEGRKRSFITSVLRSGSRRWPPKYQTLNKAKTVKKVNKKTGRQAQHFLCSLCQEDFPQKEVNVDHIEPVVDPKTGFINWDIFIDRLYCEESNLAVLCRPCHLKKTNEEKEIAKLYQMQKTKTSRRNVSGQKSKKRNK